MGLTTTFDAGGLDVGQEGFVDLDPSRYSVVGYMPGDPGDVGAHLDISSESRVFGRTPPLATESSHGGHWKFRN